MSSRFRPVIRVFVSSTFSDFKEERNALQRDLFPKLENYCLIRGFQFQAIDLRWGVPGEAGRDHRTMQICFDELRRAQEVSPRPNFLVLLGDRYGWQPLAETISENEFQRLEKAAGELEAHSSPGKQVGSSTLEVLRTWYRRDDNALPVEYVLRSRNEWPDSPAWTEEQESQAWTKVEKTLWEVVNRAYPQEGLARRFADISKVDEPLPSIVKFQASATEQEIWRGALVVPDAPEHVVVWFRTIRNRAGYLSDERAKDFFNPIDAPQHAASELRGELCRKLHRHGEEDIKPVEVDLRVSDDGKRLEVTADHLKAMCNEIEGKLRRIVDQEINTYWQPTVVGEVVPKTAVEFAGPSEARKLELEEQAHELFGESRAPRMPTDRFVGREKELKAIADYLRDENDQKPLVVYGPSGTGKTALLARAAQSAAGNGRRIFVRFLGTTPQSSNLRSLLTNFCRALRAPDDVEKAVPVEMRELQDEFDKHLASATAEKPILLFFDALDQLDKADAARQTYWLRTPLSPHVKVVVSCIFDSEGDPALNEPYSALERRKLLDTAIGIGPLSAGEAMEVVDRWLGQDERRSGHKRRLTEAQRTAIAASITPDDALSCRQPLYLHILFEECRLWPSWESVSTASLGKDTAALLHGLFKRLAEPAIHGPLLVESALSYIASARRGLSENEILEVLCADPEFREYLEEESRKNQHKLPAEAKRIPIAIWSRLRHDLDAYLTEHAASGGPVLNFYHRQVADSVRERFLDTPLKKQNRHRGLAEYFQGEDYFLEALEAQRTRAKRPPPTPRPVNVRKVDELPWQRLEAAKLSGESGEVEKLLTNLFFLEAKVEAGMAFDLAGDFSHAVETTPVESPEHRTLQLLDEALRRDIHFMARHPTSLFQCMWNSCWWYDCADASEHYDFPPELGEGRILPLEDSGEFLCTLLVRWREQAVAAQLVRWVRSLRPPPLRLGSGQRLILRGHENGVGCLAFSRDGRHVASGSIDESVRLWDPESGRPLQVISDLGYYVSDLAFSADGTRLIIACGASIHNWVPGSSKTVDLVSGLSGHARKIALFPDDRRLVTCAVNDDAIRVFDLATKTECAQVKPGGNGPAACVAISPDGQLVVGSLSDSIHIWRTDNWETIAVLQGHKGPVSSVSFSNNGLWLLSGAWDGDVRLWDTRTWVSVRVLPCGDSSVTSARFSPDGEQIVSSSGHDRTVRIWNAPTGKLLHMLRGHDGFVFSVAFSPDGKLIGSSSDDGTVRLWDWRRLQVPPSLLGHHSHTISNKGVLLHDTCDIDWVQFLSDGSRFLTAGGLEFILWDTLSCQQLTTLKCRMSGFPSPIALSPDDAKLATCWNRTVTVWNVDTGERIVDLEDHEGPVICVEFSPDGKAIATGCEVVDEHKPVDGNLRLWNSATGELLLVTSKCGAVRSIAFSDEGLRLVCGYADGRVRILDIASGSHSVTFEGIGGRIVALQASLDGEFIFGVSQQEVSWFYRKPTTFILNARTGDCLDRIEGKCDLHALALPSIRYFAIARGVELVIHDKQAMQPVAWFAPGVEILAAHPSGLMWAGSLGKNLYVISLEGVTDNFHPVR